MKLSIPLSIIRQAKLTLLSILLPLLVSSCTSITKREYEPFVRQLDDKSEISVSTYPAGFPRQVPGNSPSLEKLETHDELYFQIYVRDRKQNFGPNPHITSINIHSFSYRMGDQPLTELLTNYPEAFWMQNNPRYEKIKHTTIPYVPDSSVFIEIDLTLNGKRYKLNGNMPARESKLFAPTFILNQSI
jgi:hypothetical protein